MRDVLWWAMRAYSTTDVTAAYQYWFRQAVKRFLRAKEIADRVYVPEARSFLRGFSSDSSRAESVEWATTYAEWFRSLQGHLNEPMMRAVFRLRYLQPHLVVETTFVDGLCSREHRFYAVRSVPDVAYRLQVPVAAVSDLDEKIAYRLGEVISRGGRLSKLRHTDIGVRRSSDIVLRFRVEADGPISVERFGHEFRRQGRGIVFDLRWPVWIAVRVGSGISLPAVLAVVHEYFTSVLGVAPDRVCFYDCRVVDYSNPSRVLVLLTQFSSLIPVLEI